MRRRAVILVLDGVGVGAAPDADRYGDAGSNTLAHVAQAMGGIALPNLQSAGLGNVASIEGVAPEPHPQGAWGTMTPASAGKDST
nr:phosphopentomutase [Gemmatimonadaceae bacterium]